MAQATPFQKEAWTEYGIGVLIILGRIFARWKVVGVKNWQGDDYFAILALLFWTAELTMLELIAGRHDPGPGQESCHRLQVSACWMGVLCDTHLVSQGLHVILLQPLDTGSHTAEARQDQRGAVRVVLCRGHLHHFLPLPSDTKALADIPGSRRPLHCRPNQLHRPRRNQRLHGCRPCLDSRSPARQSPISIAPKTRHRRPPLWRCLRHVRRPPPSSAASSPCEASTASTPAPSGPSAKPSLHSSPSTPPASNPSSAPPSGSAPPKTPPPKTHIATAKAAATPSPSLANPNPIPSCRTRVNWATTPATSSSSASSERMGRHTSMM
ncbi:uncharacterized protein AFUA_3G01590 [Aspergillus fumigatus Af293]|uniref:Uncharacterized protein n=1 Tax=Aspergillus fumigatus (strain ATCC MYA-4609 / CBS 101355 / FGSC A1100 / Af293) TaxID=330879 RepID=Q4WFN5_ASPFU|nr:conserved hypothetical protein [Aspergillus fumigatus Af293]EAL86442.1 conserved hypothetical protein [Aspergillus fumigatus Af293]